MEGKVITSGGSVGRSGLVISLILAILLPGLKPLVAYGATQSITKKGFILFCMVSKGDPCDHKVCPFTVDKGGRSCGAYLSCDTSREPQTLSTMTQDAIPFLPGGQFTLDYYPALSNLWEGVSNHTSYPLPPIERPPCLN